MATRTGHPPKLEVIRRTYTTLMLSVLMLGATVQASPLIVAHRGASADAPENTMAAFTLAWEQGADAIECDVWMTKDKQLVCIHDKNTKKYSHIDMDVTKTSYKKLSTISVGGKKSPKWKKETAPLLSEVLKTVPENKKVFIEIKDSARVMDTLKEVIEGSSLSPNQIAVISFKDEVIKRSKELLPDIDAFLLISFKKHKAKQTWGPSHESVLSRLDASKANGLDANASSPYNEAFIRQLKEAGMQTHVWTINNVDMAKRYKGYGIDSITTDIPGRMKKALSTE